jgi:hypothetical protein
MLHRREIMKYSVQLPLYSTQPMNVAGFARGKIAGAVMVGSAGTAATETIDKVTMDSVESVYRPYILKIKVVICVMRLDYGTQGSMRTIK